MHPIKDQLSVHHIGGRAGTAPFTVPSSFGRDISATFYDADVDCLDHVRQSYPLSNCELNVLPHCLGAACGKATFTINYDPYTSSVKDLNPAYASYYLPFKSADYVLSEAWKTMEKRVVDLVTLDSLYETGVTAVPPPDLLSIPPTWSSKVSFEQSKARFRQSPNTCESQSRIVSSIRGLRKWRSKLKRSVQKRLESLSALLGPSSARGGRSYSEVELVLSRYSLSDQANLMRTMRLNKTRL